MKLSLGKCWGLLIFDIIGLAISGYGYLLGYQVLATLPNANAYIILMGFFVGIKIVVLSLYDLNRNMLRKNIPFIGALISVIGNGIIFGLCFFMIPEVPITFFIGLTIADFLFITLCHLLWWLLIGKDGDGISMDKAEKKEVRKVDKKADKKADKIAGKKEPKQKGVKKGTSEKKTWLSRDEEESEYDSIFTTLLENEKRGQQSFVESPKANEQRVYEEEKRYQTSDFLNDIKQNLKKEQKLPPQKSESRAAATFKPISEEQIPVEKLSPMGLPIAEESKKKEVIDEPINRFQAQKLEEPIAIAPKEMGMESTRLLPDKDRIEFFADLPNVQEKKSASEENTEYPQTGMDMDEPNLQSEEDILSIERRLGYLFHEIEKSMQETHYLQGAVVDFQQEVETYEPIAGDEKIVAAGNLIREKLKMIIDKQFVVDEVLDDLIRLSKLINNRINDLDLIEAGINQRKIALDQKDVLIVETQEENENDPEIEIMAEEVVLENLDSEFIVAEGDYETIRKYLTENPEK